MDEVLKHLPLDVEWRMRVNDVAFVRARSKKAVTISSADVVGLLIDPVDHREMAQDILDGLGRGLKEDGYTPDWKARRVNCWAVQNPPEGLEIEVYRARLSKNGYRGQVTAKTRNRNGTLLLTDVLPTADEATKQRSVAVVLRKPTPSRSKPSTVKAMAQRLHYNAVELFRHL